MIETFPALSGLPGLRHGFILRNPAIDVKTDRETALRRLEEHHHASLATLGIAREHLATGEQIHGDRIAVLSCRAEEKPRARNGARSVSPGMPSSPDCPRFPGTDGLVTNRPGQHLGVYVADCGAVFLADPARRACGLVHSGKKGTEQGIAPRAIQLMQREFGSVPADLVVQLAPCIRPPAYEIDFAAKILADCAEAGIPAKQIHDCGTCTTSDPERYYSYRKEKGRTGRLFAVIGWELASAKA